MGSDRIPESRRRRVRRRAPLVPTECVHPACCQPIWDVDPHTYLCRMHALFAWSGVQAAIKSARIPDPTTVSPTGGWIYYLRVADQIKVGYASHLGDRMKAYPPNAELLACHPGTRKDEQEIHSLLSAHRVAGREWYRPHPEVVDRIEAARAKHGAPIDPFLQRRSA